MRKILVIGSVMVIFFFLAACGNDSNEENNANDTETIDTEQAETEEQQDAEEQEDVNEQEDTSEEIENERGQDSAEGNDDSDGSEERIIVPLDSGEIIINVFDNPTSREFLEQLPLTLTFEEYAGFEKLSYPPEELTTKGAPTGYEPERGDFSYFSPWGNVTMFYDSHRYSNGLVKMGEVESGVELLDELDDDFTVTIEIME